MLADLGGVYNTRFYLMSHIGMGKENERFAIQDRFEGNPLGQLVKLLFPSPAEQLEIETNAEINLAKQAESPCVVSVLVN